MSKKSYPEPVAKLLTLGEGPLAAAEWQNYPETIGLSEADVPLLMQMLADDQFQPSEDEEDEPDDGIWGPLHAARALGQLRADAAIPVLLKSIEGFDEDLLEDVPKALGMIGRAAIAPCVAHYRNTNSDEMVRSVGIYAISEIPNYHPDTREECLATLMADLEQPEALDPLLLSYLIDAILQFKAAETAPLIEKAFETGNVDELITGSWPAIQVSLGLKQASDFSPEELKPTLTAEAQEFLNLFQTLGAIQAQAQKPVGFAKPTSRPQSTKSSKNTSKKAKKKKKK